MGEATGNGQIGRSLSSEIGAVGKRWVLMATPSDETEGGKKPRKTQACGVEDDCAEALTQAETRAVRGRWGVTV